MFTFSSNNDNTKSDILGKLKDIIEFTNELQITPLTKVHALNLQMHAKLSNTMAQYTLGITWVKQDMDIIVNEKGKAWLSLPPCALRATMLHLPLPTKRFGLSLSTPSMLYDQMQLSTMLTLAKSGDKNRNELHKLTAAPQLDALISPSISREQSKKLFRRNQLASQQVNIDNLRDKNLLIRALNDIQPKK